MRNKHHSKTTWHLKGKNVFRLREIKLRVKMVLAKSFMKLSFIFQNRIQLTRIMKLFREVASNADKNNDANFFREIQKMKTELNLWQTRDLMLYGKSPLAKKLGASINLQCFTDECSFYSNKHSSKPLLFSFVEKQER